MRHQKKIAALALALLLCFSLAVPAFAADTDMDARLQAVTLKAKQTLGIQDNYDNFTGSLTESDPTPQWSLNWSNDEASLQVRITESGKILQYYYYNNEGTSSSRDGSIAKFPSMTLPQAQEIAKAFLGKVLASPVESAELTADGNQLSIYKTDYYFQGALLINGLQTPVSLSLTVDTDTRSVTAYSRSDDGQDYASLPSPDQAIAAADASKTLFGSVSMKLNYALSQEEGKENTAYPQYTPAQSGNQAVDALTGKLIDIAPIYSPYPIRLTSDEAKSLAGGTTEGLTETELKTAAELKGVLSKSALETDARAVSELGLGSGWTLSSVNYYSVQEEEDASRVVANLSFTAASSSAASSSTADGRTAGKIVLPGSYKTVTLDAKQGTLLSVSSSRGYTSEKPAVHYTREQAESIARSFAGKLEADRFASTVLEAANPSDTDSGNPEQLFTFTRTANGIPFPQNGITVSVDTETGYIADYSVSWDDDIQFASAENLISAEQAADLYTKAVGAVLSYVSVAKEEDASADSELCLAYAFSPDSTVWGVDAASGSLLKSDLSEAEALTYTDLSGSYAASAITKLAQYGIGFPGGTFQPNRALTQKDLLTLLVAAGGSPVVYPLASSGDAQQEEDDLYQRAYSMGLLTKADRQPSKLISRAELAALIVSGAGYGKLAKLPGIYQLPFHDASSVPADLYGAVAIARGLGFISGDTQGYFHPTRTATRAEAALMLCSYMGK